MAVHVPAWKRLGLTLKNQTTPNSSDIPPSASSNKKRKLVEIENDNALDDTRGSSSHINTSPLPQGRTREESAPRPRHNGRDLNGSVSLEKRGSKASKRHDGTATEESVPPQHHKQGTKPSSSASSEQPSPKTNGKKIGNVNASKRSNDNSANDELDVNERKRVKRQKREARRKNEGTTISAPASQLKEPTQDASSSTSSTYLSYLNAFHSDKENWKFNKNQQKNILKYAFDVSRIPDSYQDSLLAYLEGLQGHAARERIESTARKILEEPLPQDPTTSNVPEMAPSSSSTTTNTKTQTIIDENKDKDIKDQVTRDQESLQKAHDTAKARDTRILKSALKSALKKSKTLSPAEQSREFQAKKRQRARAEAILANLMKYQVRDPARIAKQQEGHGNGDVATTEGNSEKVNGNIAVNNNEGKGKRVRARKRRTGLPDDDDTSSSSSSSSSELSESSDSDSSDSDSNSESESGSEDSSESESD